MQSYVSVIYVVKSSTWNIKVEDVHCVYSVLQEAVSTGDPELVQLVLQYRDYKRATERLAGIPELLSKLRQVGVDEVPVHDVLMDISESETVLLPKYSCTYKKFNLT